MSQVAGAPQATGQRHSGPALNPLMVWLLQSPFHHLVSGTVLLVKYRGRKTGIERAFPVGYATVGDEVVILVGAAAEKTWWRNFVGPWPITLVLRGRTVQGTGLVVRGESDEGVRLARHYFDRHPGRARAGGIRLERGKEQSLEAMRAVATGRTFVRVSLSPGVSS